MNPFINRLLEPLRQAGTLSAWTLAGEAHDRDSTPGTGPAQADGSCEVAVVNARGHRHKGIPADPELVDNPVWRNRRRSFS
jgi:hypothetical protein